MSPQPAANHSPGYAKGQESSTPITNLNLVHVLSVVLINENHRATMFMGVCLVILIALHAYTLIVVNMQCLRYAFHSLLSLQEHSAYVKGHQNNP